MIRITLISVLLALVALPAQAHDDRTRAIVGAGVGAAVGAAIGGELGGRNETVLGGAIGGAVGAAIATDDRHDGHRYYRRADRYDYRDHHRRDYGGRGRWDGHERRGPPHCPPGLAKQGRCWR